ncbi:MAG TPA: hypothetical protein VLU25_18085 [Acidobacteriota bacterium]|nr:hypothetical protein [Acidobacteriota bacterium]
MTNKSLNHPPIIEPATVPMRVEEFERISSCASALHSVLHKTPQLDAEEKLDVIEMTSNTLSRTLSKVHERMSDRLHEGGDDEEA